MFLLLNILERQFPKYFKKILNKHGLDFSHVELRDGILK